MIVRVLIALVGAAVVTTGLLLGMNAVTSLFRERHGERVFRITDILPRADSGRPERPPPPERQPEIPEPVTGLPEGGPAVEPPAEPASPLPQTLPKPKIEPPRVSGTRD